MVRIAARVQRVTLRSFGVVCETYRAQSTWRYQPFTSVGCRAWRLLPSVRSWLALYGTRHRVSTRRARPRTVGCDPRVHVAGSFTFQSEGCRGTGEWWPGGGRTLGALGTLRPTYVRPNIVKTIRARGELGTCWRQGVSGGRWRPLDREFLRRDPRDVAPGLLGKLLIRDDGGPRRVARIVEVEAYCGSDDPAAHTHRGRTDRNATMFAPAGHLYMFFTYGLHHCANVVCGNEEGVAVLLRAAAPIEGLDAMYAARGPAARRDRDLCSGPAKLAQAFGLDLSLDGTDLLTSSKMALADDGTRTTEIVQTTRVGINVAAEKPWRWYVTGDPNVSQR